MGRFAAARLGHAIVVSFLVTTIAFFLIHLAPGDPFALDSPRVTEEVRARWREQFGYDRPLAEQYLHIAASLRAAGINTEVYGAADKLGKQMKYADRSGAPIALLVGSREKDAGVVKLKLLRENREVDVPAADLVAQVRALLG